MKKIKLLFLLSFLLLLTGCSPAPETENQVSSAQSNAIGPADSAVANLTEASSTAPAAESTSQLSESEENTTMNNLVITVGNQTFHGTLAEGETAEAFKAMLPLTVNMDELNGNEKYYYFSGNLPTNSQRVGSIQNGDLMLFGSNCLVLFYESFSTSYSYSRIAALNNPDGLAQALGRRGVEVTFELAE